MTMTLQGKPTRNTANNVYTGGITPKHEEYGVYSKKDLENCKNLVCGLAIGGAGVLLGLVLELIK